MAASAACAAGGGDVILLGGLVAYAWLGNLVAVALLRAVARRAPMDGSGVPLAAAVVVVTWPAWVLAGAWFALVSRGAHRD